MPGSYHESAEIQKLTITTNNFTHFAQIAELATSYLTMVDRARELFYRIWDSDLSEPEIKEYNFLVSVLGMRDIAYDSGRPIYYELARKFAPVYKEEAFSEYSSYITYRGANYPAFYSCKELYDYPEILERLVNEFPHMKSEIGKMALLAKNFLCSFVWSDEPVPPIDATYDEFLVGMLRSFGDDTPSWYHRIYVPKTEKEIGDDADYIDCCKKLAAPHSKGGLKLPTAEIQNDSTDMSARIKRTVARHELLRGTANG